MKLKRSAAAVICIAALIIALGAAYFLRSNQENEFTGKNVKTPDAYELDIECMNGRDECALQLRASDALRVHFEVISGSLRMKITAPDGSILYSGNGTAETDFAVNIPADGEYGICVTGRRAQGTIRVQAESKKEEHIR